MLCNFSYSLKRAQRKRAATAKDTPERAHRRRIVARIPERIRHRQDHFCPQLARRLVQRFDVLALENLAVNHMVHHHCLAKSMVDAAWSYCMAFLTYKAAYAGRQLVAVNPAYTSQDCSQCGHRQKNPLALRVHDGI